MHRILEMKRVLWDFQHLVEQLSEEETLQRPGSWRIIATEHSLIRDQWAAATEHTFCPQHQLLHRDGCWHSFNSVKYMVLLSNASLHLHTSCWPGPTVIITHQQRVLMQNSEWALCSPWHSGYVILYQLKISFFPPFSQANKKTTRI